MTFPLKVCKLSEGKNSIDYAVHCDCGSTDHTCTICFEANKDFGYSVQFFYDLCYVGAFYDSNKLFKLWRRIKDALRLVFIGYIELQGDFVIREPEHFDNFIEALKEGREFMDNKV